METAVGAGGSVDTRINQAKSELIGNADNDYNTLGKIEIKIGEESNNRQNSINSAKSEIIGGASSDYNTLGKTELRIKEEKSRATDAEITLNMSKANKATTLSGYSISNAYTKQEVNELVSTPHQNYVTVSTKAELDAIVDPATDTIYRVSSYDFTANNGAGTVDATKYSEYAYSGTTMIPLTVKSQIDEIFDISEYHSGTIYADLTEALGVNGANIPATIRQPGMSIKFIKEIIPASYTVVKTEGLESQPTGTELSVDPNVESGTYNASQLGGFYELPVSTGAGNAVTYWMEIVGDTTTYTSWVLTMEQTSNNKYVQYRYMLSSTTNANFANVANWQGVDDEPISGSDNLVKSGGFYLLKAQAGMIKTELGSINDYNITQWVDRTDRRRIVLAVDDIARIESSLYEMYIYPLNVNYSPVSGRTSSWVTSFDVSGLNSSAKYIIVILRNIEAPSSDLSDKGDEVDADVKITYKHLNYEVYLNNRDTYGIRLTDTCFEVSGNGFLLYFADGKKEYYIARENGAGYKIPLANGMYGLIAIDTFALQNVGGRNNPANCIVNITNVQQGDLERIVRTNMYRYIPICYYSKNISYYKFIGKFADIFGKNIEKENNNAICDVDFTNYEEDLSSFDGLDHASISGNGLLLDAGIANSIMYNKIVIFNNEEFTLRVNVALTDKILFYTNRNDSLDLSDQTRTAVLFDFVLGKVDIYVGGSFSSLTM